MSCMLSSSVPCNNLSLQGNGQYINRVTSICYDCRPTVMRPLEWCCEKHLVAGFANAGDNHFNCNCDFVTVGNLVFLRARHNIPVGTKLYVKYRQAFNEEVDQVTASPRELDESARAGRLVLESMQGL
jgi:hypothetical protein